MDLVTTLAQRFGETQVARLSYWDTEADAAACAQARVHVGAATLLIGPWDTGGPAAACGECLHLRWLRVRSSSERMLRRAEQPSAAKTAWPIDVSFVVDAAAMILERAAGRPAGESAPEGCAYVTSLDLVTLQTRTALLERDPLCPSCATWVADAPTEKALQPRPSGGGSRLAPIESYDLIEDALINAWSGVLGPSAVEDVRSPTTAPVCGRVDSRAARGSSELTWSGQTTTYGRSRSVGMLEGLERYSGSMRRQPVSPVLAAYQDVADWAVDPRVIGLYPAAVYTAEPGLTRFDPAAVIPWVWAHSLRDRRPVLVAHRNVFYGGTPGPDRFVDECSNGCASGSCFEEAVVHGLLEVIERDAFLLAWYAGERLPVIDVESSLGAATATLIDRAGLLGYDVDLLDTTSDAGVPVVTAFATRRGGGDGFLVLASGASLDPAEAADAALGEVLTYLPGRPRQARRRRIELEAMADDYYLVRDLRDHAELFTLPRAGALGLDLRDDTRRRSLPSIGGLGGWSNDLTDDLSRIVDRLAMLGHDVVVVDQTSPEHERRGVSAVRVIVPGFLPIDFGWTRQRALHLPRVRGRSLTLRAVPHPFP